MVFVGPDLWLMGAATPDFTARGAMGAKARSTRSVGVGTRDEHDNRGWIPSRSSSPDPVDVLNMYSRDALVHGVRYFTKEDISCAERTLWVLLVFVCGVFAVVFMHIAWGRYMSSPVVTTVENTFYPLYRLPFPAVTVCPTTNVRRPEAELLIFQFLAGEGKSEEGEAMQAAANASLRRQIQHALSAMSKLQHPFFRSVDEHLREAGPLLQMLAALNVSRFMREVLPPCGEVFERCYWQGTEVACCEEFRLQRYDGGFCYSFNSLTSDAMSHCESELTDSLGASWSRGTDRTDDCLLRHNTACGTATGLELYLRRVEADDSLGEGQRLGLGYRILVHQPDDFPEEGNSLFIPQRRNTGGNTFGGLIKVSPSLTESTKDVRALPAATRGCLFPDERRLNLGVHYTLQNCLLECRLRHLATVCGCLPYFFGGRLDVPECNLTRFQCLSEHSVDLRFYRPPERMAGTQLPLPQHTWVRVVERGIDCSACLPTCHDSVYDLETDVTTDNQASVDNFTYVDIFYKDLGAVKYGRELAFGQTELLVSLGGIVSLFLGVSLLSGVEIVYYVVKLAAVVAQYVGRRRRVRPGTKNLAATATGAAREPAVNPRPRPSLRDSPRTAPWDTWTVPPSAKEQGGGADKSTFF